MGYKAYLQCGANKLHLDANPYELAFGFVPPAVTETPNIGIGTSANQYGGGKLISKRTESGAYSFSVRVMGSSNAHNEALIDRLDRFIRSGTEAEPVYFCWRPADNVDFEPLYGQWNATRRAKVITGSVYKSGEYYSRGTIRESAIFADVNMVINPPEGKRQRVATATGGIIENTIGTTDGVSRGVIVAEATTNVITNPIFGNATPLTNWTVGADLIGEVVTDTDFVLFGSNAVRLTKKTSGSAFSFYESINVGGTATWCMSCYAKKPDSSAVTASDLRLTYGATTPSDSTYVAMGDGWYRIFDNFTGIASAQNCGCTVQTSGGVVYVTGFQLEQKAYPTPLAYGDLLGCAWSGTAHASSTARTAASLKIPAADCVKSNEFTWWIAFRANTNFSDHAGSVYVLQETATNANLRIGTTGQTVFSDGTNSTTGAATAITAGTILIYHATMSTAGLKLYRNGAQDGSTQATFAPLASPTYLFVGSDEGSANHPNVTILGAGTYARAMTAAEVAADYANMYQAAIGLDTYGARVDWIPYLWTKDGDDVFDQYTLSTTHADWGIVSSVPGSMPSDVEGVFTQANDTGTLWIGVNDYPTFASPALGASDWNGTVLAGAVSGEVKQATADTTEDWLLGTSLDYLAIADETYKRAMENKPCYAFLSLKDLGSTDLSVKLRHTVYGGGGLVDTDFISLAATAGLTQYMFGPISIPQYPRTSLVAMDDRALFRWRFVRTTGSATVQTDYFRLFHGNLTALIPQGATEKYYYQRGKVYGIDLSDNYAEIIYPTINPLVFYPSTLNHVIIVTGNSGANTLITATVTVEYLYVIPRWALS